MLKRDAYLAKLKAQLLRQTRVGVKVSGDWTRTFASSPGVYAIFKDDQLIYVGETGNIKKRMRDLLDSRHHTFRRSLGERLFSSEKGYKKASSKRKFAEHIEKKINTWMEARLNVAAMPVDLGRKELEEEIHGQYKATLYNKRGKRSGD